MAGLATRDYPSSLTPAGFPAAADLETTLTSALPVFLALSLPLVLHTYFGIVHYVRYLTTWVNILSPINRK